MAQLRLPGLSVQSFLEGQERKPWVALRRNLLNGPHRRRQRVIDSPSADFYCQATGLVADGILPAERDRVLTPAGCGCCAPETSRWYRTLAARDLTLRSS